MGLESTGGKPERGLGHVPVACRRTLLAPGGNHRGFVKGNPARLLPPVNTECLFGYGSAGLTPDCSTVLVAGGPLARKSGILRHHVEALRREGEFHAQSIGEAQDVREESVLFAQLHGPGSRR